MSSGFIEIAHQGGKDIAGARHGSQFQSALEHMRVMTDPEWLPEVEAEHNTLDALIAQEPFNRGIVRERAIRLGVLPIVYADDLPDGSSVVEVIPDMLHAYVDGVHDGGFSRGEAKALTGRVLSEMILTKLDKTGSCYAFENAKGLRRIGLQAGVLDWRERATIRNGFITSRRRRSMTLPHALGTSEAQTP